MADIKSCGTCEYKMTGSFESPCKECCENRNPYTMWEAIPLPPTTATEGEAASLVEKFMEAMPAVSAGYEFKKSKAKQCAIIHCELMMKRLPSETTHYTNLIKQIEQQ